MLKAFRPQFFQLTEFQVNIKLHNFSNICSRSMIQIVPKKVLRRATWILTDGSKFLKFQQSQRRRKKWVFSPKGPTRLKISCLELQLVTVLWQKEYLKCIGWKESNDSLKSSKSIKVQWYIYSYSFILWGGKLTKTCIQCTVVVTRKEVGGKR